MGMIAVLVALALQDPAELIRRLGDDAVDVRLAAEEALRSGGKGAVAELRKAAVEHPDPEVRARAAALVRHHVQVRWHTDLQAARAKAVAENKPLLVFSTMGPLDGFV